MTTAFDAPSALDALSAALRGRIVRPADPDYEQQRRVMIGTVDARPAAIARVADAADVATVIRVAREAGAELAVRSGGHSGVGHGTIEGGLVLDVRDLRSIDLDPEGRTAWAGTGLTAGEYSTAVSAHGLATGFGDTASVGIGGITLGGGIGYLVRKHGLTIDSLLAAEIVTADGEVRLVDADHEPDLFWAIRGGGGNFGVATRFRFRLHPVPAVFGGILVLPATPMTVAGFAAALDEAPEELSGIANVMPAPPMPFLAPEVHGRLAILGMLAYVGETGEGEHAVAPFRSLATPLADMLRPIAYPELFPPDDPDYRPKAAAQTLFADRLGLDEARLIVDRLGAIDTPMRVAQIRALGGAMARIPVDATAFAHRGRRFLVNVAAFFEGEADRPAKRAWVDELSDSLRGEDHGAYVNFLTDEGEARVRDAYPGPTWDRLRAIKRRYDPGDFFRRNHNIPPAEG